MTTQDSQARDLAERDILAWAEAEWGPGDGIELTATAGTVSDADLRELRRLGFVASETVDIASRLVAACRGFMAAQEDA